MYNGESLFGFEAGLREDKDGEKDRAKSPNRSDAGRGASTQSLGAIANGESASRHVSSDLSNEPLPETLEEHAAGRSASKPPAGAANNVQGQVRPEASMLSQPTIQASGNVLGSEPRAGPLSSVPGRIEDYMNDSDREKLHTARQAAKRDSLLNPADESATPRTAEISIDPNYKVEDAAKSNLTDPEPTTPKASEANAGLRALTTTAESIVSPASTEQKAA